jgi:thiamine biosynthesis lipoprotein
MGTDIVAIAGDASGADSVMEWFGFAESVFSRFLPDSELTTLNDSGQTDVAVSAPMAGCLSVAQTLRTRTQGLVDPAVGGALIDWGYDTTFSMVADREHRPPTNDIGDWSIAGRTVTRRPGIRLDLGGIAKGWACDQAVVRNLAEVVSAGGDVRSINPDTVVEIEDPWGTTAARVLLGVGGLATSSTTRRRWTVAGEEAHHIIDPRTMRPASSPVYSATVMASTAAEAEAGAKAVLLHGEDGLAWAERQRWIDAALVVWHDGSVYATTGWEMAA